MATLGIAAAGAALGNVLVPGGIFGISGAGLGWTLGAAVAGVLFPPDPQRVEGARITDLTVQTADHGTAVPKVYGSARIAGNIIWKQDLKEVVTEEEEGGKGTSPSVVSTTYSYYATFAVGVCEGPIGGIKRIWADGNLLWDEAAVQPEEEVPLLLAGGDGVPFYLDTTQSAPPEVPNYFVIYPGTSTQDPDPTIESYDGVGNVPAYRNLAYVVFTDMPVEQYGNRIPNLTFEVVPEGAAPGLFIVGNEYELEPNPNVDLDFAGRTLIGEIDNWRLYSLHPDFPQGYYCNGHVTDDGVTMCYTNELRDGRWWDGSERKILGDCLEEIADISTWAAAQGGAGYMDRLQFWKVNGEVVGIGEFDELFYHSWDGNTFATIDPGVDIDGFNTRLFGTSRDGTKLRCDMEPNESGGVIKPDPGWLRPGSNWTVTSTTAVVDETYPNTNRDWTGFGNECYPTLEPFPELPDGGLGCLDVGLYTFTPDNAQEDRCDVFLCDQSDLKLSTSQTFHRLNSVRYTPITLDDCYVVTAIEDPFNTHYWGVYEGVVTDLTTLLEPALTAANSNWARDYNRAYERDFLLSVATRPNAGASPCGGGGCITLGSVVEDICKETGLSAGQIDMSALTECITGYVRTQRMAGRSAIEPLQQAYLFDLVEVNGKLTGIYRDGGADTGLSFDADDLGAKAGNLPADDELTITRTQELEIPREIRISYWDYDRDYQPGMARSLNPIAPTQDIEAFEVPVVWTASEAKAKAFAYLQLLGFDRVSAEFALSVKHLGVVPTDIVTVNSGGSAYRVRLESFQLSGFGVVQATGRIDSLSAYDVADPLDPNSPTSTDPPGTPGNQFPGQSELSFYGSTAMFCVDIPILRDEDDDAGMYALAYGALDDWRGGSLYRSPTNTTFAAVASWGAGREAAVGRIVTPPGPVAKPWTWDLVNTLNVTLYDNASLQSATDEEILNTGANAIAVGPPAGEYEIIQFGNAVQEGDGSWTLSRLLRGRRGTDHNIGSAAQPDDMFYLLDLTGVRRVTDNASMRGLRQWYRSVSYGTRLDDAIEFEFINNARGIMPFSPVAFTASRDYGASEDMTIGWKRRTRIGGEWLDFVDVPLGERSEAYELDLAKTDDTPLRTLSAATNSATYTLAQYNADAGESATSIPPLKVTIYQISETAGRGFPRTETL